MSEEPKPYSELLANAYT